MMAFIMSSFMMVFIIFTFILYIYILIDILKHEFTGYNKIIWILVLVFFPVLGALLYLIFGRSQRIK
jgi:hypothetical protein